MKYGIKLWSSNEEKLFKEAVKYIYNGKANFLELYINPNDIDKKKLSVLENTETTIHATHGKHGLNISQYNDTNKLLLEKAIDIASFLNSSIIVLHPGKEGTISMIKKAIKSNFDKRWHIENMPRHFLPKLGGGISVGSTPKEIKSIMQTGVSLCLDIEHAFKTSISLNIPYKTYIQKFLKLKPRYFHICDGTRKTVYDEHLDLGKGEIDWTWIKHQIQQIDNPYVVFETPRTGKTLNNDIKNIEFFKKL